LSLSGKVTNFYPKKVQFTNGFEQDLLSLK